MSSSTPSQAYLNPKNVDLKTAAPGISDTLYAQLTSPTTPWQQDQNYLPALSEAGVPIAQRVFGVGHYLRPCMVEFIGCTNVLMENYSTNNTPFWQHHPTDCKNVVIRGVTTNSIGPNNDGFDPDACNNVLCDNVDVQHRRRLHRDQVGQGSGYAIRSRAESRDPELHDE